MHVCCMCRWWCILVIYVRACMHIRVLCLLVVCVLIKEFYYFPNLLFSENRTCFLKSLSETEIKYRMRLMSLSCVWRLLTFVIWRDSPLLWIVCRYFSQLLFVYFWVFWCALPCSRFLPNSALIVIKNTLNRLYICRALYEENDCRRKWRTNR
jgi:hypothetical protein